MNYEEIKLEVNKLLDGLDYSTSQEDMVWLENYEVQLLRNYIDYLENKC